MQGNICHSTSGFVFKGKTLHKYDISYFRCSNSQVICKIGRGKLREGSLLIDDFRAVTGWKV